MSNQSGLGELLHYIADLVDQGSEQVYAQMDLNYRARYTPVLRAIDKGATTITAITTISKLTQSAISQSVALMEKDGLIIKNTLSDARKSSLHLTEKGETLMQKLKKHWESIFAAITQLEQEIGYPLLPILEKTASALEHKSFDQRIKQILNES
jgi:DNA-binding MarR family transcriptional regulator